MTTIRKLTGTAALLIGLGVITGSAAASGRVANEGTRAQTTHSYFDVARVSPLRFILPTGRADLARVRAREFQAAYGEALKIQVIETPDRDGVRFSVNLTNWDVLDPDDADLDAHLLSYFMLSGELKPRFVRGVS